MVRWSVIPILLLLAVDAGGAPPLEVGVATVDITPPVGYRMAGYFSERLATGTHDPLLAKAIVWRQGEVSAAFVACDLIAMPAEISRPVREKAASAVGIPVDHIVIAATHSHTGPLFYGSMRNYWHKQNLARLGKDPPESFDYRAALTERLAEVIKAAQEAARPVAVSAGSAQETRLAFNRRFHMKDGTVRFNPGRNNPDVVRVAGPIDPQVGMVLFTDRATSEPLAALSNFALHLDTVGGTEYCADYPYYLERKLRDVLGDKFVSIFGTGTCGDINHIDVSKASQLQGPAEAERIGTTLGETILKAIPKLTPQPSPQLAVKQAVVEVPAQRYSAEQVKQAAANMAKIGGRELSFLEQVETNKIIDLDENYRSGQIPLEVQVIRISPEVALVALPGEVFVELGLAIKEGSPFKTTLVVELCNDVPAYIPTKKAFAEGSYEIVNSRIQTGGGEAMATAAIEMLRSLAP